MSYARNLLSRGEEVVFESREHWFGLIARSWLWLLAVLLGVTLLIWWSSQNYPGGDPGSMLIAIGITLLIVLPVVRVLLLIWAWRNQEWLVTSRRVIRAEGIFNKNMSDSSLEKINDARLTQSLFGRIFGFGTLDILTAAEEEGVGVDDFPMMSDPVKFKIAMLNQKELMENPNLAPPPSQRPGGQPPMQRVPGEPPRAGSEYVRASEGDEPPAPSMGSEEPRESITDTLGRLGELRDRGLITPEEFDAKKQQLLERM